MLEKLHHRLADFCGEIGRTTLLRYGGGALLTDLPRCLDQDLPEPHKGAALGHPRHATKPSSISSRVRHLDGN